LLNEDLQEYTNEVAKEFGIEHPIELLMTDEEDSSWFSAPKEEFKDLPGRVYIYSKWGPKAKKEQIRHELAHAKLHWDVEGYDDAEDMVRKELEADLLAGARPFGLQYLMSVLVYRWGLSKRQAYLTVKRIAGELGIPKYSISRAKTEFYKIPDKFFKEQRKLFKEGGSNTDRQVVTARV